MVALVSNELSEFTKIFSAAMGKVLMMLLMFALFETLFTNAATKFAGGNSRIGNSVARSVPVCALSHEAHSAWLTPLSAFKLNCKICVAEKFANKF